MLRLTNRKPYNQPQEAIPDKKKFRNTSQISPTVTLTQATVSQHQTALFTVLPEALEWTPLPSQAQPEHSEVAVSVSQPHSLFLGIGSWVSNPVLPTMMCEDIQYVGLSNDVLEMCRQQYPVTFTTVNACACCPPSHFQGLVLFIVHNLAMKSVFSKTQLQSCLKDKSTL